MKRRAERKPGHGVGIACGVHFTSGKFHPNVNADFCAAGVKVNEDELLAELRVTGADEWEQAVADAERDLAETSKSRPLESN